MDRDDPNVGRESTQINIEGLTSLKTLHLGINSFEIYFSIRNLSSLKIFHLLTTRIDENKTPRIFDQLQNIEELELNANLYYFNLDSFVNLRSLSIGGIINDGFNFENIKNISSQLDEFNRSILIEQIDYETVLKILNGSNFSNLQSLIIYDCNIRRIEKKFMEQFPNLKKLRMINCNIETIEDDAFSHLKDLNLLDLSENLLKFLYNRQFSGLVNLEKIILLKNRIEDIEYGLFSHIKNIKKVYITNYTIPYK